MAERDDRMAQNARNAQSGQNVKGGSRDSQQNDDMVEPTDTLTDRNLSGASTWATLDEENSGSSGSQSDGSDRGSQSGGVQNDRNSSGGSQSGGSSGSRR